MTTARDIVHAALRKALVIGAGDDAAADDASDALFALNSMMHGWKARSVDVSHTDLALSDAFPLDAQFIEGTVYMLASRLAPDYQVPQPFDADDWFRTLQAAYHTPLEIAVENALTRPPSREDRDGNLPLVES
jgi:homospermidine synthase